MIGHLCSFELPSHIKWPRRRPAWRPSGLKCTQLSAHSGGLAGRQFSDVRVRRRHFGHQDLIWGSVTVVLDHHALNASGLRQRDGERLGIMSAVILSGALSHTAQSHCSACSLLHRWDWSSRTGPSKCYFTEMNSFKIQILLLYCSFIWKAYIYPSTVL